MMKVSSYMHGQPQRRSPIACRPAPVLTAFTLIELLVVIAVTGILIAIALPALIHVRTSVQETQAIANSRQNAHIFITIAASNKDTLPLADPANGPGSMVHLEFLDESAASFDYFVQYYLWPVVLVSFGEPWTETFGLASRPNPESGTPLIPRGAADDWLSRAVLTRPEYWSGEAAEQTVDRWKIAKMSTITAPSAKALLLRRALRNGSDRIIGSFFDGHTSVHRVDECAPSITHHAFDSMNMPMLTTASGVAGRDI